MFKTPRFSKTLFWILLIAITLFFGVRVYYRLTDDFRIANMVYEMPHEEKWEVEVSPKDRAQLFAILDQSFSYIGKGAQSYAFLSEDGKYVIKFFKFKHLKPSRWVEYLPSIGAFQEYREKKQARKERLLTSVFSGYKLAYDVHRKEAGIIFLHLNRTTDLDARVLLIDKIGRSHDLELDPIVFIVQEAAVTTRQMLADALDGGDVEKAKLLIDKIFALYMSEYRKGIYDRDHGVMHNTGFVGMKPIHLDVGKLSPEPRMRQLEFYKPDLIKIGKKFEFWFNTYYPDHALELIEYVEKQMSEAFGEPYSLQES